MRLLIFFGFFGFTHLAFARTIETIRCRGSEGFSVSGAIQTTDSARTFLADLTVSNGKKITYQLVQVSGFDTDTGEDLSGFMTAKDGSEYLSYYLRKNPKTGNRRKTMTIRSPLIFADMNFHEFQCR